VIKRKYDINLMKFISLFESFTKTRAEDAFELDGTLYFIVKEGMIGKAVGKQGANYRKLESVLNKKIKMVENSPVLEKFVLNAVFPLKLANVEFKEKKVFLTAPDTKTRGMLIGRGASVLKVTEAIVKRYFDIDEIRVS